MQSQCSSNFPFPGNSRQIFPYHSGPWNNGNEKITPSSESFERHLQVLNDQTHRITVSVRALETELEDLKAKKEEVQQKASKVSTCREKMCLWTGLEIMKSTEKICNVAFPVFCKGEERGRYSIGFAKTENLWCLNYHSLPLCIKMVPQQIRNAQLNSDDKLLKMVTKLQFEVEMFNRRRQQFEEAKTIESHNLRIHPSLNTLNVTVEVFIEDASGSDLSSVYVQLSYQPDKFLPEEPLFIFNGGSAEDREELKSQLASLEHLPLKEALISSFNLDSSTTSAHLKEENYSLTLEVLKSDQEGSKQEETIGAIEKDIKEKIINVGQKGIKEEKMSGLNHKNNQEEKIRGNLRRKQSSDESDSRSSDSPPAKRPASTATARRGGARGRGRGIRGRGRGRK